MSTDDRIVIWGCIVCSNAWSASSNQPLGLGVSAFWLLFAALILYSCRTLNSKGRRVVERETTR